MAYVVSGRRSLESMVCATVLCLAFVVAPLSDAVAQNCTDPQATCGATLSSTCLSRVGAGSLAADAPTDCAAQFDAYRSCLARVAEECGVASPAAPSAQPAPTLPVGHRVVAEAPLGSSRLLFALAPEVLTWSDAEQIAIASGGRLAVIDTAEKQSVLSSVLSRRPELFVRTQFLLSGWFHGPWIGGFQLSGAREPAEGWVWSLDPATGETTPIVGGNWFANQPDDYGGGASYLNIFCVDQPTCDTWNDAPANGDVRSYIVELPG